MVKRNPNFAKINGNYLFQEVTNLRRKFMEKNPYAKLISLGVGDTTNPITSFITDALQKAAKDLGTVGGYSGYGPEQGNYQLRELIAEVWYHNKLKPEEIFISDGAKCDLGRLQLLFGSQNSVTIQEPSYPVYVEGSLIHGVSNIHFMPCLPSNDFFPDFTQIAQSSIIYICSPNNPTGATATKKQLEEVVRFAKKSNSIIIFDSAYSSYIQDPSLPKSIYEIDGAMEVAIETSSFSKIAGFTGVRLGWNVVPKELKFEDGSSVRDDWFRLTGTIFNGASNIAQQGGLAVLKPEGIEEVKNLIAFYMENARLIKEALENKSLKVYGGVNAPYLWVHFPGRKSWDIFHELLEKAHLISIPGSGFGPSGEGFIRLSAFGHRENILEAVSRIDQISF